MSDELILVGYTNGYQIFYSAEEQGSFYSDTDGGCLIPLYMLAVHAHRISTTTNGNVTLDEVQQVRRKNQPAPEVKHG